MNILLTGFMCAGKTTIGRKLAKLLEYSFIDTDTEIEEDQGCSVTDIFKWLPKIFPAMASNQNQTLIWAKGELHLYPLCIAFV